MQGRVSAAPFQLTRMQKTSGAVCVWGVGKAIHYRIQGLRCEKVCGGGLEGSCNGR